MPEHAYLHWPLFRRSGVAAFDRSLTGRLAGVVAALLLAWALVFNLSMLPYTVWFKAAMFTVFPVACLLGIRYSRRTPAHVAATEAAPRSG